MGGQPVRCAAEQQDTCGHGEIGKHVGFRMCHLRAGSQLLSGPYKTEYAGVVELVDSTDLGSVTSVVCGFESRRPHQSNIIRTRSSLWETGSDYLFISTDTKTPTFRMALSSVPNPNREDHERRKSAIRKTGKAAPIIGELPCLLLCYSVSCGAFTLFAFSICCAFHSANSRCPSSLS